MSGYGPQGHHGRCKPCAVIYEWDGKPLLRDARCKRCGGPLGFTTSRSKERRVFEEPATVGQLESKAS